MPLPRFALTLDTIVGLLLMSVISAVTFAYSKKVVCYYIERYWRSSVQNGSLLQKHYLFLVMLTDAFM